MSRSLNRSRRLRQNPLGLSTNLAANSTAKNSRFGFRPLPLSISWVLSPIKTAAIMAASVPGALLAGPDGGQVVAGSASINSSGLNTIINQSTARAAINWQNFSIGSAEYVQFIQPGTSSVALNRVVGGNPSSILGSLTSNGQVFLVNPAGVYFGVGAQLDVGSLVATTMNIDTDDFMAGNYLFNRDLASPTTASVVNEGIIAAREGGYVVLSGDYVENSGIIDARLGTVALAAGAGMTLDITGDDLINFTVDSATLSNLAGVNNSGDLYADGGRVIMTAEVAGSLVNAAVNNSGRVQAQGILEQDGAIYLVANGGDVENSGILDASGPSGDGGFVRVRSDHDVILTNGSEIDVSGGDGKGGVVRVVAEQTLDFQQGAVIDATSATGEQGGFVEVSGHGGLALKGDVHVGEGGQLLIDPANLDITGSISSGGPTGSAAIGESFIETKLKGGANVALVATNSVTFTGIFGGNDINGSSSGSGGDLFVGIGTIAGSSNGFFSNSLDQPAGPPSGIFTAASSGGIDLNGVDLVVDGHLALQAGSLAGSIDGLGDLSAGGDIELHAVEGINATSSASATVTISGDNVTIDGDVTVNGSSFASVDIDAIGDVNVAGFAINLPGSSSSGSAVLDITAGSNVTLGGDILVSQQGDDPNTRVLVDAGGTLTVSGDVTVLASGLSGSSEQSAHASISLTATGAVNFQTGNQIVANASMASGSTAGARADVLLQSRDSDLTVAGDITVFAGGNVGDASAQLQLRTGEVVGPSSSPSYIGGGNLDVTGAISVTAVALDRAVATAEIWAIEDGLSGPPGGSVSISGTGVLVQATELAGGVSVSSSFNSADAFIEIEALDSTVTINAPILASASGSDGTISNGGSYAGIAIGGGLAAIAGDATTDIAINNTVEARVKASGSGETRVEIDGGGDIKTSGAGLVTANQVWLNPSYTSSGAGVTQEGASNAEFNIATNAKLLAIGNNLNSVTVDNSAFSAGTMEVAFGASYNAITGLDNFNPAALAGAVDITAAAGVNMQLNTPVTANGVALAANKIRGQSPVVVIEGGSGGVVIDADLEIGNFGGLAGFNLPGAGLSITADGAVDINGDVSVLVSSAAVDFGNNGAFTNADLFSTIQSRTSTVDVSGDVTVSATAANVSSGSLVVRNTILTGDFSSTVPHELNPVQAGGDITINGDLITEVTNAQHIVDARTTVIAFSDGSGNSGGDITLNGNLIKTEVTGNANSVDVRSVVIAVNGNVTQAINNTIQAIGDGASNAFVQAGLFTGVVGRAVPGGQSDGSVIFRPGSGNIIQNGTVEAIGQGAGSVRVRANVVAAGDGVTNLTGGDVTLNSTGSIVATGQGLGTASEASNVDIEAVAGAGGDLIQAIGHTITVTGEALSLSGSAGVVEANIDLFTGLDYQATPSSYVTIAGGDVTAAGTNTVTATGNHGASYNSIEVVAYGNGGVGGDVNITGGTFAVSASRTGASTGGSFSYAEASVEFLSEDGQVTIDASATLSATASVTTTGGAFAYAEFSGATGLSINAAPLLTATGGSSNSTEILLATNGLATGSAVLTADEIFYNPVGSDSYGSFSYGGTAAVFNVNTNAKRHMVSSNLTSITINNSAFVATAELGLGFSYQSGGSPEFTFDGGGGTEIVSFTAGGGLDLISDINVGSLSINAGVINKSSAFGAATNALTINTAGDLAITATGLFVSGSSANLSMSAGGNLLLDTQVFVSTVGAAFDATIDLTAANNLTINQSITAAAIGSLGAEAVINLTGGATGGAVNINNDVTATAQALGSIGSATEDFEATIDIIGAGTSDVFLNSGTLLAQVIDGGAIAGHNNTALVHAEAIGGNLTQAAGHTAIADATGGTRDANNTTIGTVSLEADDQVNVAGTVTATAAGEAFTTAVVTIGEKPGANSGAINVTGANITVAATDFGTPLSGSSMQRAAILEIRAGQGDVSVDAATSLAVTAITINRAFASASVGADVGQLNIAADLTVLASGFRATESFFVFGGTGITGGGNLGGDAIATAASASALFSISSTSGNVSLGDIEANATGAQANAVVDITTTGLLTINNDIDALAIASIGSGFAQVGLTASSIDLAADVTAQNSAGGIAEVLLNAAGPVTNTPGGTNTITALTVGLNTTGGSAGAVFGSSVNPLRVNTPDLDLGTLGSAFVSNALAGVYNLAPADIAGQNLTLTLAGGLNFGSSSGLVALSVDGLNVDVGGVITADAPHVQITSTGDIAIKAAGFNLTGSISSASLTMFASGDIVIDTPINVTDNGGTPSVFVDIEATGSLTINEAILADATGSAGASVIVNLQGGSASGAVNINNNVSAIARAQGAGGPFPFDATVDIVGAGTSDVFLNSGTVLASVSDGGSVTPIGGTALVHAEALGGDLTQLAGHTAIADATGGTNQTNAIVELTADDQVNVAGTVTAAARGAGAVSALAHIHEHIGGAVGSVNVLGATISATAADFGTPGPGSRSATLEIISEQGGVTVNGATTLATSAITTTGSAFATGTVRGTGGLVNFATDLTVLASAGSFASALVDMDAGTGITGGANLRADAVETGAGSALARVHVDTAAGNATLGNLAVNASGGEATGSIDVGQHTAPIAGVLTVGNISGNVTGNSSDGHLNIDLDANNGINVAGAINAVANAGANGSADAEVFIDINTQSAGADISVTGSINATATATGVSASASVDVFASSGDITLGNVTVTANGNSDAFGSIDVQTNGGDLNLGNLTVNATDNNSDASGKILLDASNGAITAGALAVTATSGLDSADAIIEVHAKNSVVVNGSVVALADAPDFTGSGADVLIDFSAVDGGVTINGDLIGRANGEYGEAEIFVTTGNGGVGGDINVSGDVEARATMTSYADEVNVIFSAQGTTGDVNIGGNVIAANIDTNIDPTCCTNDALVQIDAVAGSITVGGKVESLAVGLDSDGATADVDINAAQNVTLTGGVLAEAVTTDDGALASVVVTAGNNIVTGAIDVRASGGSYNSEQLQLNQGGQLTTTGLLAADSLSFGGAGFNVLTAATNLTINSGSGNALIDNTAFVGPAQLQFSGGGYNNINVTFGGDGTVQPGTASATNNLFIGANGSLDVSNTNLTAGGSLDLVAGGGNLLASNAVLTGGNGVFLSALDDVIGSVSQINAGMLGVFAGNNIDLSTATINVGSNSDAVRLPGDPLVTDFLLANGVSVPNLNPNALFLAGNSAQIGNLNMSGHYLWVEANEVSFTGTVTTPQNVLVQLLPSDPLASISFENSVAGLQQVNYGNAEHLSPFTGTTIALGAGFHQGEIVIGELGEINVGSKNILFVTQNGNVTGDDQVTTTGLLALLSLVPVADELVGIVDTVASIDDVVDSGAMVGSGDFEEEVVSEEDSEEEDEEEQQADGESDDSGGEGGGLIEQDDSGEQSLECA